MKIIYIKGFDDKDRYKYKIIIQHNVLSALSSMVGALPKLKLEFENSNTKDMYYSTIQPFTLLDEDEEIRFTPIMLTTIKNVWSDAGIQKVYARSNEYQLADSTEYYLSDMDRIGNADFVPTDQDILYSRKETQGVVQTRFMSGKNEFVLVDVGGQRGQRRKWIAAFEQVAAIIFVTALSAYDQVLAEDGSTNRMVEALQLFKSVCNSPWFRDTTLILFLNKMDIFEWKVKKSKLKDYCPNFAEYREKLIQQRELAGEPQASEAADGMQYITNKFMSMNRIPKKVIYYHYTCATCTASTDSIFDAVTDNVLRRNLIGCGLI